MERSLQEHIGALEQKLKLISTQIMQENNTRRRNQLESELRAVESALAHYRSAFEIESRLSGRSIS
jgi:Effector-associated domain 9